MRISHLASAAIVLAPVVQATGIRATAPPCTDKYKPFTSVGCFSDDDSSALPHRSAQDQSSMTVEQCTAECKSNGYRYAGLKYWGECYCGSALTADAAPASQCSSPCTGDSSKTCGGNGYLAVYQDPTFTTDVRDTTVDDYVSLGCHTDSSPIGRAFPYQIAVDETTIDTETCIEACRSRGYPYAGTEYAHECWCGTVLYDDTALVDDSQCNLPCEGKTSEICGGSSRLSLYVDKKLLSSEPCGYKEPEPKPTTTTTTTAKATSTTTTALCTATVTVPPTCEFSCGKWCASPLPDWKDQSSCLNAAKSCALQVASCFKTAGWPSALECFEFSQICSDITTYCNGSCKGKNCSKQDCWSKNKPGNAKPTTSKTVFPCSATAVRTSTTANPTATACPPAPTNICTQPSNSKYGYGPGKPVGGIELPVVGCNDIKEDFSKKPFKLYNNANSRTCPSFSWGQRPDVCDDACYDQYEDCRDTYVKSCGNQSWRSNWHKRDAEAEEVSLEARTWGWGNRGSDDYSQCAGSDSSREWAKSGCDDVKCWGKGGNSQPVAESRCKAQYKDCLAVNKRVNPGNSCKTWC